MSLSNAKVSSSLGYQVGDLDEGITMLKAHELSLRPQEAKPIILMAASRLVKTTSTGSMPRSARHG